MSSKQPRPRRYATLGESLDAVQAAEHAEAVEATLQWVTDHTYAALRELLPTELPPASPVAVTARYAIRCAERAANELRRHLGRPEMPLTFDDPDA